MGSFDRFRVLFGPCFVDILISIGIVTRHMRICYITVCIIRDSLNYSCTLNPLCIWFLYQLAAAIDHPEVEGCPIIHGISWAFVEAFHVV